MSYLSAILPVFLNGQQYIIYIIIGYTIYNNNLYIPLYDIQRPMYRQFPNGERKR